MDVVYVYKHKHSGSDKALRYSLRSLMNTPHKRVFIVGDKPLWVKNIIHIPFAFDSRKRKNEWNQIRAACLNGVGEDFYLMNDDFYILKRVEHIPFYVRRGSKRKNRSSHYKAFHRGMSLFPNFIDVEVHIPMPFNRDKFLALFNVYPNFDQYLHRSIYANHYQVQPIEIIDDCKFRHFSELNKKGDIPFMSTADVVEKSPLFDEYMTKLFPKTCSYE